VPGYWDYQRPPAPEVTAALKRAFRRGTRIVSICTGAFALAAAGLLNGRTVTTHWAGADEPEESYPQVRVDRGRPLHRRRSPADLRGRDRRYRPVPPPRPQGPRRRRCQRHRPRTGRRTALRGSL